MNQKVIVLAATLIGLGLLSGCGSKDGGGTEVSGTSSGAPPASAAPPVAAQQQQQGNAMADQMRRQAQQGKK